MYLPSCTARSTSRTISLVRGIEVDDLDEAVTYALGVGAELADCQPQDGVGVMLDPAGHPFRLYLDD